jgi:signal transduction histidine kinase
MEQTSALNGIRDLEARNSAMLRVTTDVVFVLTPDGTFIDCHAREPGLLFAPRERLIGRTVREIFPSPAAAMLMHGLERAIRADETIFVEYELSLGEPRWFEARFVRAERERVLAVVRDVTESKRSIELNRDLAGRLIASQEAERTRIARDLHDGVCQDLASIAVEISRLRRTAGDLRGRDLQDALRAIEGRAAGVAETLRLLSHGLHPSVLQHIGLVAALQAHCAEVQRQHQLRVRFFADDDVEPERRLVGLSLFRIAQEALGNVARHGRARHAAVSLIRDGHELVLVISDDGCGFDLARAQSGLGLLSMEERARLVRGGVTISTAPGFGTTIEVRVPADAATRAHGGAVSEREALSA